MEVARQGLLPYGHIFGKVNPKIGSPVNAYLLQYILSIVFIVGPPPGAVYQFIVAFAAYPVYVSCHIRKCASKQCSHELPGVLLFDGARSANIKKT